MTKLRGIVIVGASAFAEVAYEYFTHDSSYDVVGFAVERSFLDRDRLFGLPLVPLEEIEKYFPPADNDVYVAIVYSQLNRLRTRLAAAVKARGYRLASYVSSSAKVWPSARLGEHCFIFEDNVIQPFVTLNSNVVLWSGNHIGHHSTIGDNVFVSSHVVVSGFCSIGANSFLGVNVAVANNVNIAADNWIGPGIVISADTQPGSLFRSPEAMLAKVSALRFFKVPGTGA
jgi:sugar O-acyltransferase (sialic acid O-acetyltransferase NeuD family)